MIKKNVKFVDLEENTREEEFWFHLSKAELAEVNLVHGQGLEGLMRTLNAARDGQLIMDIFKKIIGMTVGQRDADGVSFVKDPIYVKRFMNSDAYSSVFMELLEGDNMAKFIIGCLPKDLQEEARRRQAEETAKKTSDEPWITENREPTQKELMSMTREQMAKVMLRRVSSN